MKKLICIFILSTLSTFALVCQNVNADVRSDVSIDTTKTESENSQNNEKTSETKTTSETIPKTIEGYNSIPWGSSTKKVMEKYTDLAKNFSASVENGETFYESIKGDITRYFRFFDDKLYWVRVIYYDIGQSKFDSILEKIKNSYGGEWIDKERLGYSKDDSIKFGYILVDLNNLERDTWIELDVKNDFNRFGAKIGEFVMVTYRSLSMESKMQKVLEGNLEL